MASIQKTYTKEIQDNLNYIPTWLPGKNLELGDIGYFDDREFKRVTNLKNMQVNFEERVSAAQQEFKHRSDGGISVKVKLAGEVPVAGSALLDADAGLIAEFSKENAVLFQANQCTIKEISDFTDIEKAIIDMSRSDDWKDNWRLITEIVHAGACTVLISKSKNGKVELKAETKANIKKVDLANLEAGLTIVKEVNINTSVVADGGLTPLFRVRRLKRNKYNPLEEEQLKNLNLDTGGLQLEEPQKSEYELEEFWF